MSWDSAPALAEIDGTVERSKRFESGWTIIDVRLADEKKSAAKMVGTPLAEVEDGASFTAHGRWKDSKYGRQFAFEALTVHPPKGTEQIIRRLVTYPGIGEKTAEAIAELYGDGTWDVFDTGISALKRFRGIGEKKLDQIRAHHAKQNGPVAKIQHRLIELGAHASMAERIHDAYGLDSIEMINRRPYAIAAKVDRFGFAIAEKIARAAGLDMRSDDRVDAGVMHVLKGAQSKDGHCAMPPETLVEETRQLLNGSTRPDDALEHGTIESGRARLVKHGALREYGGLTFTARMDRVEQAIANAVGMLATTPRAVWDVGEMPDHLSPGQEEAVRQVAASGFVILTGGPGTGKSEVLKNILPVADRAGFDVIMCAPTGRAAKRMAEATGREAKTIHRLLGMRPGVKGFGHDQQNPLPPGLLIVDEASMKDAQLMDALLLALTREHRVLLVGDVDQLPSVGAGNVLRDLIEAAESDGVTIPVVRLQKVFRQAEKSSIITNAHAILKGRDLESDPHDKGAEAEFLVLRVDGSRPGGTERALGLVTEMASTNIPAAFGLDRMTQVQVLSPMRRHAETVNRTLQGIYTRSGEGFSLGSDLLFFRGDRVMCIKNDYDRNVFNGDIGTVVSLNSSALSIDADGPTMTVDFDGVIAEYARLDIKALRLAYAMTIHKSQGSEFPAVLIPILREHSIMLRRNLLYTAMTRAVRLCVIVGDPWAIRKAIETADAAKRHTGLQRRVIEMLGK